MDNPLLVVWVITALIVGIIAIALTGFQLGKEYILKRSGEYEEFRDHLRVNNESMAADIYIEHIIDGSVNLAPDNLHGVYYPHQSHLLMVNSKGGWATCMGCGGSTKTKNLERPCSHINQNTLRRIS